MTLTEAHVRMTINEAADAVIAAVDMHDEGARDAINLVVNVFLHWLLRDPDASVEQVIEASYEASPKEVLDWCRA